MSQAVLIADDDPLSRQVMRALVEELGFTAHEACNGQEALDLIAEGDFVLVFMDCLMPGMDGFKATRLLRRSGSQLPVVAITAACNENDCTEAGMNYFISKPVTRSDIRLACEFLNISIG